MIRNEVNSTEFICTWCGEVNHTFVDPSQGQEQEYIEDCQVCCQPNKLTVFYDEWNEIYNIQAEPTH